MGKKLLVVDGNSILNRAFYGIRALTNAEGFPTSALFGLTNMLLKQIESIKPDYAAVAFDLKGPTFRHKQYAEYKAGRKGMPDELALQLPVAKELCSYLGFSVLSREGYEADDILGTLNRQAVERRCYSYVFTGDRDSLQLITDSSVVLLAGNKDTVTYDMELFKEKYGIYPSSFVDVKALMGDPSDNIPGVEGIGEKTALALISKYGSIANLYDNYENENHPDKLKEKLKNGEERAVLSYKLAKIVEDVPLGIDFEELKYNGFKNKELYELFTRLGFSSHIKRLSISPEEAKIEYKIIEYGNLPKGKYSVYWEDSRLLLSSDDSHYILENNFDKFLSDEKYEKIFFDSKEFFKYALENSIALRGCIFDVMLASYVLDSSDGGSDLARIFSKYLSYSFNENSDHADCLFKLYREMLPAIDERKCKGLLYDIEMPLAKTLANMEHTGFKVDIQGLNSYGKALEKESNQLRDQIYSLALCEFNINSPKQLGEVLFDKLGLPHGKKTKTGYSTSAEILERLKYAHPIIDYILEYRQLVKLKGTYTDGLAKVASPDGRIHTNFNQALTQTGRLSSAEPNLQNIPIRTERGRFLRRFFVPKNEEYLLVDADYSQIELRILAHISGDETMINAFKNGIDIHALTASQVFGVPLDMVTPEMRGRAKAVNFGIVYGISDFSLAQDIGVSKKSASEYIQGYMRHYPFVASYLKNVVEQAKTDGFVTTILGRRRYIPELKSSNSILRSFGERVAMNSPIQGSSADIIKIAMINAEKTLLQEGIDARIILQVHDELVVEAHRSCAQRAGEILKYEMENALLLSLPLTVDIKIGQNWLEAH